MTLPIPPTSPPVGPPYELFKDYGGAWRWRRLDRRGALEESGPFSRKADAERDVKAAVKAEADAILREVAG